jgi:hypothetical protein
LGRFLFFKESEKICEGGLKRDECGLMNKGMLKVYNLKRWRVGLRVVKKDSGLIEDVLTWWEFYVACVTIWLYCGS